MIRTATLQGEQANRRHLVLPNGTGYWRSDLMISAEGEVPAPQAFLIQQDARTLIASHFHAQDQFQVVAEGGGMIGRHALKPLSVHFASRYTGYGPIASGDEGLSYFTLRAVTTPRAYFLPESRDELPDVPRRNLYGPAVSLSPCEALRERRDAAIDVALERQSDGVAAWLVRLPPNGVHRLDAAHADRFYLVAEGTMVAGSTTLPRFATAFVSAEEPAFDIVAGSVGVEVLALQFPISTR
jgi:hypothetical protein